MRTLRKYWLEILYVSLALLVVYAIPAVYLLAGLGDVGEMYYVALVPLFVLISVLWYTLVRRGGYIFAVAAVTIVLLGQGLFFFKNVANPAEAELSFRLVLGVIVTLLEGGAAVVLCVVTAFINACRTWNRDRKKRLQKTGDGNTIQRITSFTVDHDTLRPGIYISRTDGDVVTYDLRTRTPNAGAYMDTRTAHSVEHMFATYVRNSAIADRVIYFGPMGCRTGFYLLVRDTSNADVLSVVKETLSKILAHEGDVFGASRKECGNYLDLDLADAKKECAAYLAVLNEKEEWSFRYE